MVEECARKHVHALVILSAGFAELGDEGAELQRSIVTTARANGMRVVGPNCLGIANTDPAVRLNATFAPTPPVEGNVAFLSQSGGLGIELLSQAAARGMGISQFVSVGNKSDVSGNDLLQFWDDDPRTGVILLYLESFGNPRKFARIARRISRHKPIVAVKSGRTPAGSRAASSHTAALASSDVAVDALFRQAGVIRVDTLEELLDTAQMLSTQPIPNGPRVAIVGNAGGPGILAADACAGRRARVSWATRSTSARRGTPEAFASAISEVLLDPEVDALIVIYAPPVVTDARAVARAVAGATAAAASGKPVVSCFLGRLDVADELAGDGGSRRAIPDVRLSRGGGARTRPRGRARGVARPAGGQRCRARRCRHLGAQGDDLGAARAGSGRRVARRVGCRRAAARSRDPHGRRPARAGDIEQALAAAGELGYPVVLKVGSPEVVHKTDVGGVALGLGSADAVAAAFGEMEQRFGAAMGGAIVQRMAPPGLEVIVGVTQDPLFGPLLLFGLGGVTAELLADRALRILPVTDADAHELVRSLRTSPLLFGYRGAPALDVAALEDLILRVARLAQDVPEITEMDLNPIIVHEHGVVTVDAKIRCAPAPRRMPAELRRMRD